jgi:hypothetical protein
MNWGNKLVVAFIVFGCIIGTLVYKAVNTRYDLVSKDYYKEELRYQDRIDGLKNASSVSNVRIEQSATAILIQLPKEQMGYAIKGDVFFYCITDERKDVHLPLELDSAASMNVLKSKLQKGAYNIKLNWELSKALYYNEQKIIIQ